MNVRSLWAWDSRRIHEEGYGKCWGDWRKSSRQWKFEITGIRNGRCWLHFKIFYERCNSFFVALFQCKKFESRYLLPYLQYFGKCWVFNPYHVTVLFLHLLKTSGNKMFSGIFRGYRKRPVKWNGLKDLYGNFWSTAKSWEKCPSLLPKFIIYANLGAYELMNFIKSVKVNEKSEADVHGV